MRDIGAALRAFGPRRGVDELTRVGDAHSVLDLEVVIIRAPFRDANRRGVHDPGGIALDDDFGTKYGEKLTNLNNILQNYFHFFHV